MPNSTRPFRAGESEVAPLKAELSRIEREVTKLGKARAVVDESIVAKAAAAEQQNPDVKPAKKSKKRKPRKRAWKDGRPPIPYPDVPLSPHASGKWMKKIRGRIHYFGRWAKVANGKLARVEGDGWEEALKLYKAQADDLHAGRTPRIKSDALTVMVLCNRFLTALCRLDPVRRPVDGRDPGQKGRGTAGRTADPVDDRGGRATASARPAAR